MLARSGSSPEDHLMSVRPETRDYILDQLSAAGDVSARRMFGEMGLYCDGKFVGVICNDELFFKQTEQGRAFLPRLGLRPPYPGAHPYLHVTGDVLEDADRAAELLKITTAALPMPPPRRPSRRKRAIRNEGEPSA